MKRTALVLVLALAPISAWAQEEVPRGELGISYENFQASDANSTFGRVHFDRKTSGFNFRGTYNVNRWAAVETTFGFQPNLDVTTIGGVDADIVLGASADFNVIHNEYKFKATGRQGEKDQVGLFVFAGPGWIRIDPNAVAEGGGLLNTTTKYTFEFGGGIEYYPHRNAGLRIDISDLIVRLGTISGVDQPTTNNFVLRVGASFRFK